MTTLAPARSHLRVWVSMGEDAERAPRLAALAGFQVDAALVIGRWEALS
jgi:hypothetical protein